MTDKEFLTWIASRLVNVHGESDNVDFVQRLRQIASKGTKHDHNRYDCDDCWEVNNSGWKEGRDACYHD